jgi:hypothetical protein
MLADMTPSLLKRVMFLRNDSAICDTEFALQSLQSFLITARNVHGSFLLKPQVRATGYGILAQEIRS